jgi:transcriptional regulator with XRE-family HTH domain
MTRSDLIQQKMLKKGLTVQTLAKETGLSRPTIYNLLESKREATVSTLQAISRVLEIPLSKLIEEVQTI